MAENQPNETIRFDYPPLGIRLTDSLAVIGSRTYRLSEVVSVHLTSRRILRTIGMVLLVPAILAILVALATIIMNGHELYVFGALPVAALLIPSIILLILGRGLAVRIETSGGRSTALRTKDVQVAARLVEALEAAMKMDRPRTRSLG